eukprot:EG_transcript_21189
MHRFLVDLEKMSCTECTRWDFSSQLPYGNRMGSKGAQAVAEAAQFTTALRRLELQGNIIGPEGARALAETLKVNTTLQQIDLQWNHIGPSGARALAAALLDNTTLQELHLQRNGIAGEWRQLIEELLQRNHDLVGDREAVEADRKERERRTMFVNGLPLSTSHAELEMCFPTADFIKMGQAKSHTFALVRFPTLEDALAVARLGELEVAGQPVSVSMAARRVDFESQVSDNV